LTPRTVLFAIPELDSGGPDRVIFELLSGIDRGRFEPVLAVSRSGGRYFERLAGRVPVYPVDDRRYPVRSFARLVDSLNPDLVFTTLRMNVTATAARFVQRRKPPLIIRQANAIAADFAVLRQTSIVKHRLAEHVIRALYRRADVVVAQSADMAQELERDLAPSQVLATIGNPVSVEEIASTAAPAAALPGSPSLIAVGRLAPQKGFDLLLPAFARFLDGYPGAMLTILGEGPQRAELGTLADELGIAPMVHMPGHSDEVPKMIAGADLLVSSSRYEGFSNVLLEAMAVGTPVLATSCPGATRTLIDDGRTGILVPPGSSEDLADGLFRAMKADRSAISRDARHSIAQKFDRALIVREYEALFERTLAAR
jgi:glycosyltransferase involved in cell wall biosynthesis